MAKKKENKWGCTKKEAKWFSKWWPVAIPGIIALGIVFFVVFLFIVKILWAWTIPDLFPGAVANGLLVGELTWLMAFKVTLFVHIGLGLGYAHSCQSSCCK
ncbi:hypothetical protein ACFLQI_01690 [Candidatus Undinarchaeota archaeon]